MLSYQKANTKNSQYTMKCTIIHKLTVQVKLSSHLKFALLFFIMVKQSFGKEKGVLTIGDIIFLLNYDEQYY